MLDRCLRLNDQLTTTTLKHNFYVNVGDGTFYAFAMSLISIQTVLPLFVKNAGGSNVAVGLIPVIWMIGSNLPQIFSAGFVQRHSYKKPLILKTGLIQRLPWLLFAILTYFIVADAPPAIGLVLFFVLLTIAAVAGSINLPAWFDLIAKITPVSVRGRLFAFRSLLGAVLGILGGWIAAIVLDSLSYPNNFAVLFLLAFVLKMVSFCFLLSLKEETANQPKRTLKFSQYLTGIPRILKSDTNYRNFLIADAIFISAIAANAFYTVFAVQKFSLSDTYAGRFTMATMTAMVFGSLTLGYIADKVGHKNNLVLASLAIASGCLLALLAPRLEFFYVVFMLSAVSSAVMMISRLPFIAELCPEDERPTYVALTNLVTAPFFITGLLAGWIADSIGYEYIFIGSAVAAVTSAAWMYAMVIDPRKQLQYRSSLPEDLPHENN